MVFRMATARHKLTRWDTRLAALLLYAGVLLVLMSWAAAFHYHGSELCNGHQHPECPVYLAGITTADTGFAVDLPHLAVSPILPRPIAENPPPGCLLSFGIMRAPPACG